MERSPTNKPRREVVIRIVCSLQYLDIKYSYRLSSENGSTTSRSNLLFGILAEVSGLDDDRKGRKDTLTKNLEVALRKESEFVNLGLFNTNLNTANKLTNLVTSRTGVCSEPALAFSYSPSGRRLHKRSTLMVGQWDKCLFKWKVLMPTYKIQ